MMNEKLTREYLEELIKDGKYEEVISLLEPEYKNGNESVEVLTFLARAFCHRQNAQKALPIVQRLVELYPDNSDSYYVRGNVKADLKDFKGAIEDYKKAIAIELTYIEYVKTISNRGGAKVNLDNFISAIAGFDRRIELVPDEAEFYRLRGWRYWYSGNYDEAEKDYNKAIEIKPNIADYYYENGINKESKKDYAGAIKDYDKAIELEPNNDSYYAHRGIEKYKLKDYQGAIADFNRALELEPVNIEAIEGKKEAEAKLKG